ALENAVMRFYAGAANVLVATTIIENGIDLPSANTLIVIDADRLGLSTLYQLKGRVGRGNRMAHAYFTFQPDKVMSEAAYKRLNAIMDFTEMGSGYKIAMRDLEIRGAGNVLGREQHGHMERVGYELYAKLLKEQLGEAPKDFETELDIRTDDYIPENYISDSADRMDCYKQIAEIKTEADRARVEASLTVVYGAPPEAVRTLISIAMLKNAAKTVRATKVTVKTGGAEIILADIKALDNAALFDKLTKYKNFVSLGFKDKPTVRVEMEGAQCTEVLDFTLRLLSA
ncbi:MAG: transcription-repair coupling factor, partial [Clostridia bacterium]|nr:transcription-repair coupling factor [Clostridia bacterium]